MSRDSVWRRHWAVDALAGVVVVAVFMFASYLAAQQRQAVAQIERERSALCAVLSGIPDHTAPGAGHISPAIGRLRQAYSRPGHPNECRALVHPAPQVTVTAHAHVTPAPTPAPTVVIHVTPSPAPAVTVTRRAAPSPSRTPTRAPAPSPSPSRSCLLVLCSPLPLP